MKDRYEGRPLYILLENLVLHWIGELSQERYAGLVATEGKLQQIYHREGSWIEILKAELGFPDALEPKVKAMWERNLVIARENNVILSPVEFARMFVDANFPGDTAG